MVVRRASALSPVIPAARATPTAPRRPAQKSIIWYEWGSSSYRCPRYWVIQLMSSERGKTAAYRDAITAICRSAESEVEDRGSKAGI